MSLRQEHKTKKEVASSLHNLYLIKRPLENFQVTQTHTRKFFIEIYP